MPCNGWNHSIGCSCGWGGFFHGNGIASSDSVTATTITPSACKSCGANIFFYRNPNGGYALFEELGHPWPKHICNSEKIIAKNYNWRKIYYKSITQYKHNKNIYIASASLKIDKDIFIYADNFVCNSISNLYVNELNNELQVSSIFSLGSYTVSFLTKGFFDIDEIPKKYTTKYIKISKNINQNSINSTNPLIDYPLTFEMSSDISKLKNLISPTKYEAADHLVTLIIMKLRGMNKFKSVEHFLYIIRALTRTDDDIFNAAWLPVRDQKLNSSIMIEKSLLECMKLIQALNQDKLSTKNSKIYKGHEACFTLYKLLGSDFERLRKLQNQTQTSPLT